MVDSQPNTGRHSITDSSDLYAVLDHHDTPGDLDGVPFVDVRKNLGATCARDQVPGRANVPIPEKVATALLYGIETEVTGFPREAGNADDEARSSSCTPWPTRTSSLRSAMPGCRRATSNACSRRSRVRSSTIG